MSDAGTTTVQIKTSWGCIKIELFQGKVARCTLPRLTVTPEMPLHICKSGNDAVSRFVIAALNGQAAPIPPIANPGGTGFQKEVWQAISRIPAGKTQTYGELAQAMGHPTAYRAVANACGKNPLPLFIPCHRVVGANGEPGGFSAGLPWKKLLLSREYTA